MKKAALAVMLSAAVVALALGSGLAQGWLRTSPEQLALPPPPSTFSNVLPADYVGPEACQPCHLKAYDAWSKHPHSVMNQWANPKTVKADFSGRSISYLGGTARFSREAGRYTMTLERGDTRRKYTVLRTVGSRFTQFFIGKQVEGPEPKDDVLYTREQRLPFAYWFRLGRWLPESYFDPWGPDRDAQGKPKRDPFDRPDALSYSQNCMVCHTTFPYLYRLGHFRVRRGFPPDDVRFDDESVWAEWRKTVDLGALYDDKISRKLDPNTHLVRMGISCESCHFGGREHLQQQALIAKFPASSAPSIHVESEESSMGESWNNPYLVNGICRQCHSAKGKTFPNGAGVGNSREALDLDASSCASELRCTHCHSPHQSIGLKPADPDPKHLAACVGCHDKYADDKAAQAHGGHEPESNISCVDCHMPRIAQGIDAIVRSHRVSSPADAEMIAAASLNACNLCHLERSIQWTVDALKQRWGVDVELKPAWRLRYRGFEQPLGPLWLMSERAAERQAATAAYVRSPLGPESIRLLLPQLNDVAPVNRMFALFGIEQLLGCELERSVYDPTGAPARRQRQINRLSASLDTLCAD